MAESQNRSPEKLKIIIILAIIFGGGLPLGLYLGGIFNKNTPPEFRNMSPDPNVEFYVGETRVFSFSGFDEDGDDLTFTWKLNDETLSETSNQFSWTPAHDEEGHYTLKAQISDGEETASYEWAVDVLDKNIEHEIVNSFPEVDCTLDEGQTKTFNVTVEDDGYYTLKYNWTVDGIDQGVQNPVYEFEFNADDTAGDLGAPYIIKVNVSDQDFWSSYTWSLTVNDMNREPVINAYNPDEDSVEIDEGDSQEFSVIASDPDFDSLTYTWLIDDVVQSGQTTDTFTWNTDLNDAGIFTVKCNVSDGAKSVVQEWEVTVGNVNQNPAFESYTPSGGSVSINEDSSQLFTVHASDYDLDTLTYTWTVDGVGVGTNTNSYTYYATGFSSAGSYTVKCNITDGNGGWVAKSWALSVDDVNRAPVISNLSPSNNPNIDEEGSQLFEIDASDPDLDSFTYEWTVDDVVVGGNTDSYTYTADYSSAGTYDVMVNVSDGDLWDTESWTLTVDNVNRAPTITDSNPTADPTIKEGFSQDFGVIASDPDLDGLTYTWTVEDIEVGDDSSSFTYIAGFGDDGTYSVKCNVSDGEDYVSRTWTLTVEEREMDIFEINPSGDANCNHFTVIDDEVYFWANDGTHGVELWKSNGTAEGTKMVKDINGGSGSSVPYHFTKYDDKIYFSANDGSYGEELWVTDGTETGTEMVKDLNHGSSNSGVPSDFVVLGGYLYFLARDSSNEFQLWKSDGTETGTQVVDQDGPSYTSATKLFAYGSILLFRAMNPTYGVELWKYTPATDTVEMVKDIRSGTDSSNVFHMCEFDGEVYFSAIDATHGRELWKTDGTGAGTQMVIDIYEGSNDGQPFYMTVLGDYMYFQASNESINHNELYRTDGTEAGTELFKEIISGTLDIGEDVRPLTLIGDKIYFNANSTSGWELWVTDGTVAGTQILKDIKSGSDGSLPSWEIVECGDWIYFAADDGTNGLELYRTDGTTANTARVADLNPSGEGIYNTHSNWSEIRIGATDTHVFLYGQNSTSNYQLVWF